MEPRAHHLLIGLFTIFVTLAAVLFALWLGKANRNPQTHYVVVFNEPVRGLSKGSMVQYNGIKVGEVVNISLDPDDPGQVRARILIDSSTPVRQNTQAQLTITGLTGLALISLNGGTADSPPLTAPTDDTDPVIHATTSALTQLFNNGDQLINSLNTLIHSAQNVLSEDNIGSVSRTLSHIEQITGSLADSHNDARQLVTNLAQASQALVTTLGGLNTLMETTNNLLARQGAGALQGVQNAMNALQTTSQRLAALLNENRGAVGQSLQGLAELGPTLRELRTTLNAFQGIARRLENNPAGYLLGGENIQEYKP